MFLTTHAGMTALTRFPAGVLRAVPEVRELYRRIVGEIVAVGHRDAGRRGRGGDDEQRRGRPPRLVLRDGNGEKRREIEPVRQRRLLQRRAKARRNRRAAGSSQQPLGVALASANADAGTTPTGSNGTVNPWSASTMFPRATLTSRPGRSATDRHTGNGSASAGSHAISVMSNGPSTAGVSKSCPDSSLDSVTSRQSHGAAMRRIGVCLVECRGADDLLEDENVADVKRVGVPRNVARVEPRVRQQALSPHV